MWPWRIPAVTPVSPGRPHVRAPCASGRAPVPFPGEPQGREELRERPPTAGRPVRTEQPLWAGTGPCHGGRLAAQFPAPLERAREGGGAPAEAGLGWVGAPQETGAGYGRAWTCGPTALDQALPAVASQLVDQVIAPRMPGHVVDGLKRAAVGALGQAVERVVDDRRRRRSRCPRRAVEAGRPRPTWSGRRPPCSWMQASAVRKSTVPWRVDLPSQPCIEPRVVVLHVDDGQDVLDRRARA